MALTVSEIRTWLNTFSDDTLIGISEEDEMTLRPHDERYHEAYLEIGMALSSEYLAQQRLPYVIPTPEIMEAQDEAANEDFFRTYPPFRVPENSSWSHETSLDEVRAFAARDRIKRKAGRRPS